MSYNLYIETPVCPCCGKQEHVGWSWQITGNFSWIISHVGLGSVLGRECKTPVSEALPKLEDAMSRLMADFEMYREYQSKYGDWGSAEDFRFCLWDLIEQCSKYPDGTIECDR